jgi:hypothetical protein
MIVDTPRGCGGLGVTASRGGDGRGVCRGADQTEFVSRLRGASGDRVLLVPVDVGKRSAMSMVANQLGEVIVDPFEFLPDRAGVNLLLDRVADAEEAGDAVVVRKSL